MEAGDVRDDSGGLPGGSPMETAPTEMPPALDPANLVESLLADPPQVHTVYGSAVPVVGLWSTARDCYDYLALMCRPGTRTLETGSGLSTVLFAALHTEHTAITPAADEEVRFLEYCKPRGIDTSTVTFIIDSSTAALPRLVGEPLDVVFIDGAHGFPAPIIDWYYAGARLRKGGMLVVDDIHLPAVRVLADFLDADQRWQRIEDHDSWASWVRISTGDLGEDWWEQPFYKAPSHIGDLPRRIASRLRGALRPRTSAS